MIFKDITLSLNIMKKKTVLILLLLVVAFCGSFYAINHYKKSPSKEQTNSTTSPEFRSGDLIFQISQSSQCIAVQKATKSVYSHCGIIYEEGGKLYVYEAIQPVVLTPLDKWISRGKNGHHVVKRLKNADKVLTNENITKMKEVGMTFYDKSYDLTFEWSDDKMYCSELIWKIYKRALNIEIGKLEQLKDFDLSDPVVKQKIKERYGDNIPLEETVISPVAILICDKLETVYSN